MSANYRSYMNRLTKLFESKSSNLLSVYTTAGFPRLSDTVGIICELQRQGVDMVEIGVPFSDPMADGPVIQHSSNVALSNGMSLALLLQQAAEARRLCPDLPFVLMGYLNPMMQFGFERLFDQCYKAGIDALIIPDLPFEDYLRDFKPLCLKYDIPLIMLITPETSDDRILLIDEHCDGFIYMVSTASTTGTQASFSVQTVNGYFYRINSMGLKHKRMIGFGISNPSTYRDACLYSSGAIVGSYFIKCLERYPDDIRRAVAELVQIRQ